ncbi:MAG TPA: hypothetical protein VHY08_01935 [Bacillota bacterium]|nr:hypothetical protein [Bacillota bacterium]
MDFKAIFETILKKCEELAKSLGWDLADSATKDIIAFLEKNRVNLRKWSESLEKSEITNAEFKSLLKGEMDLAEMICLKNAGLSLVKIDELKAKLVQIIIENVLKAFGLNS